LKGRRHQSAAQPASLKGDQVIAQGLAVFKHSLAAEQGVFVGRSHDRAEKR